jgi:hypothetical protein
MPRSLNPEPDHHRLGFGFGAGDPIQQHIHPATSNANSNGSTSISPSWLATIDIADRFPTSTGINNTRSPDTPRNRPTKSA